MTEKIEIGDPPIPVTIRHSARARRYSLRISNKDGTICLTVPKYAAMNEAIGFAREQEGWMRRHLAKQLKPVPLAFGGFLRLSQSVERVPLTVVRSSDLITFSTPASEVEMKPLVGLDGSQITISGLPSNVFHDYVQYESVKHTHTGHEREWAHSGTNGFTSRMVVSG